MTSASLMHEAGTQSWCSGTTHMDGVRWEVAVGFRMWGHMYTVADSCQRMAKYTNCEVIASN